MYLRGNTSHGRCADLIKDLYARRGCEVNVSDWRAGMRMPDGETGSGDSMAKQRAAADELTRMRDEDVIA